MTASESKDSSDGGSRLPFLTRFIATGFFSGYIPWASGTFGSLVGLAIYAIPGAENPIILLVLIAAGFAGGVYTSGRVAEAEGHRLSATAAATKSIFQPGAHAVPDPSIVVIDEIVGMWLSLACMPKSLPAMLIAFFLFRILDILKPPPARQVERFAHGWGIMLDDVVAAVYANILTRVILHAI